MPDEPIPKAREHPFRTARRQVTLPAPAPESAAYRTPEQSSGAGVSPAQSSRKQHALAAPAHGAEVPYVELEAQSNFTFLEGASHPEELAQQAARLGQPAIAICDTNSLAGIVRAHVAAKDAGIRAIVGCRLRLSDPQGLEVLVYPANRDAYGFVCRLLSLGKRRAAKGSCELTLADLRQCPEGLIAIGVPPAVGPAKVREWGGHVPALRAIFPKGRLSLGVCRWFDAFDEDRMECIAAIGKREGVPLVATNHVLYHAPHRRPLQDVLTCIRLGTTIQEAGYALHANAERHLKASDEMARLMHAHPGLLARTLEISEQTRGFSLDQLRYEYPSEVTPAGTTPMTHLRELTRRGAAERYPAGVPPKVRAAIDHELALIEELNYPSYFLTVHDLVGFARGRGILCQGRGAAANSAVCFVLGITSVDPDRSNLLFERFISRERNEPPDIDLDIEHERREEVIQYIYAKYGRERAALTAEVISYRGRSAVRDVGKAMGLSLDCVDRLAKTLDWWDGDVDPQRLRVLGLNPEDRTLRLVLYLCDQIRGFPRHLSQHVGGFVITDTPLCELVPIENAAMEDRTVIEWDKDDIDAMGMMKVDCLGLGMLTCIRKCFELVQPHEGRALTLASVPAEDARVYDMICKADTVGVFQIESRAQMAMLPRLRPRCFYDLVIEVAIVRPGPIQGKMVHPYLRRRNGEEAVSYPSDDVQEVLGRTLGVPLFQEQAMKLAIVAGGFTPGEADQLRRAMAAWKRKGDAISRFGQKLIEGMQARGYDSDFAQRCFEQIKGFSEYGFPESHAASFALLVYVSSWLKCHHPAAFAAALINSQPMGFYQPAQIVRDAQEHGVEVRPLDVNHSEWDCTLEAGPRGLALRLGMRLCDGLSQVHADALVQHRRQRAYRSVEDMRRRADVPVAALRALARADALAGSLGLARQAALWAIQSLRDDERPLFEGVISPDERAPTLPAPSRASLLREDLNATGLTLRGHPIGLVRPRLEAQGVTPARMLRDEAAFPHGTKVSVAGVVLVRQRPGTASGVLFVTIEDETDIANLVVWPRTYERLRGVLRHAWAIVVRGRIERSGQVVHVIVDAAQAITPLGAGAPASSRDFH